jgi:hypothetical protein
MEYIVWASDNSPPLPDSAGNHPFCLATGSPDATAGLPALRAPIQPQGRLKSAQLGETQGDLLRSPHCTLKLKHLFAALPVIVCFLLPGAAVLARSALVSERLPDASAGVAGLFSTPHTSAIVSQASGELPLGGATRVFAVNVSNVQNLGAATVRVAYDPAQIIPVAYQRNPAFPTGFHNLHFDQNGDGTADTVRFNVISTDGISATAGVQLPMASITWQTTGTATLAASTILSVTVDTFADARGIAMPVAAQSGVITFVAAPSATPTATPTPTATAAPTATVTPRPTTADRSSTFLPAIHAP